MADVQLIGISDANDYGCTAGQIWFYQAECTESGECTTIKVRCGVDANVRVALYSDSNNTPSTLLNESASVAVSAGTWRNVTIPSTSLTAGTKYWLAVQVDTAGGCRYKIDVAAYKSGYRTWTYGAFPNPAGCTPNDSYPIGLQGWSIAGFIWTHISELLVVSEANVGEVNGVLKQNISEINDKAV